jgi:hypothetical protein
MTHLYATLHTLGVTLRDRMPTRAVQDRERGASTLEIVFWAVASCWPWPASSTPPSTPTSRASCPASA